jgi:hypothetical protein
MHYVPRNGITTIKKRKKTNCKIGIHYTEYCKQMVLNERQTNEKLDTDSKNNSDGLQLQPNLPQLESKSDYRSCEYSKSFKKISSEVEDFKLSSEEYTNEMILD